MADPTLKDFQFLIQLVDSGLIQASFKFSDMRTFLGNLKLLTPELDASLKLVEANPVLVNIGVATLREALTKYPPETTLVVAFGGGTGTGGGTTTPVTGAIALTTAQVQDAYKALAGIAATSAKATQEFLTGPNGEKVVNAFFAEMKDLAALQADVTAGKITKTVFVDKLTAYAADTSALALQAVNFFTGKTPTQSALNDLVDSVASDADLTDFAYAKYSAENKYIAFAVTQASSATFKAAYESLSFRDAVAKAYDAIIGNAKAAAAGVNAQAAVDYVVANQSYFNALGKDALGAKAAAAGFLMSKGLEANIGLYAEATKAFLAKAYDGQATYGSALTGSGASSPVELVGHSSSDLHTDGLG